MKCYWYCANIQRYQGHEGMIDQGVLFNVHPFEYQDTIRKGEVAELQVYDYNLSNWKEITKEEYELFVKLNA